MSKKMLVGKAIKFNPSESIINGSIAKKIPMGALTEFQRKINGFEYSEYNNGPKFRNGDTVVAKITPCLENGKTAFVDILDDNEIAFGSSEFIVLRKTEYTDSEFIYYFARSPLFRERAINCMEGTSGRKRVNENTLKNLEFVFPDLTTQKSIASVLSALDAKIALNNRINAELEAMAKTLYDYWFVQFDFPYSPPTEGCPQDGVGIGKPYKSSGGKMVYNAELKRQIPEGWEVRELDFVLQEFTKGITTEYVEKSNLINLNQKVNKGFSLDRQYYKYLDERIEIPKGKYAKEKDILINSLGQGTLGRIHYFCEKTNNIVIDQHLFILRVDEDKITSSYLYLLLSSKPYEIQIERQITGSTGMQMLNGSNLKKFKVIVPNRDVLLGFESMVYPFYEKVVNNETQNQQLSELRDWLLPMLMNGQVTIAEAEKAVYKEEEAMCVAAEPVEKYTPKGNEH